MTDIQREGLIRSVPFTLRDATDSSDSSGDGRTLTGHAAVFNEDTEIDSWEGNFIETIAPGAFKKTIRERTPVLQFDHGKHPLIGSIPIGQIESLSEDTEGLYVEARLAENWLIEPVREAIENKSVSGMSFRFEVIKDEWRDNQNKVIRDQEELWRLLWDAGDRGPIRRTLKEVKVHELGPVVFPQYTGTSVDLRSIELANSVMEDRELVSECRSALAMDKFGPYGLNPAIEDDRELRKRVAKAILFRELEPTPDVTITTSSSLSPEVVSQMITRQVEKYFRDSKTQIVSKELETEPFVENTQDQSEPLRDEHSSKKLDPHLKEKMASKLKRMSLRLGYLPEDL